MNLQIALILEYLKGVLGIPYHADKALSCSKVSGTYRVNCTLKRSYSTQLQMEPASVARCTATYAQ